MVGFLDAGWMLGAMLMTTAAWRRPATAAALVADDARPDHPFWKLGIATAPILIPLALHFANDLQGGEAHVLPTLISVTLLLGLSFARSARLLQSESRARTEARASRDAALEASRAKSAFLATMSHEIRTPMNGVIGLTGLLLNTPLDERQRQYANGVHLAGEALLRIINDILDFSKIEAGKLELEIIDFNLVQVVEEAAELVAESARSKGLELLAYCSPELPQRLRGDPSRLRQVLLNLASNAVKFTDTGEVVVRAHLDGETDRRPGRAVRGHRHRCRPGEHRPEAPVRAVLPGRLLHHPPVRRDRSRPRDLPAARHRHGRRARCRERARSRQHLLVHAAAPARGRRDSRAPARSTVGLAGLRALIVDDNDTNRLILSEQLTAWGMHPDVAQDGVSALALLEEAAATETAVRAGAP